MKPNNQIKTSHLKNLRLVALIFAGLVFNAKADGIKSDLPGTQACAVALSPVHYRGILWSRFQREAAELSQLMTVEQKIKSLQNKLSAHQRGLAQVISLFSQRWLLLNFETKGSKAFELAHLLKQKRQLIRGGSLAWRRSHFLVTIDELRGQKNEALLELMGSAPELFRSLENLTSARVLADAIHKKTKDVLAQLGYFGENPLRFSKPGIDYSSRYDHLGVISFGQMDPRYLAVVIAMLNDIDLPTYNKLTKYLPASLAPLIPLPIRELIQSSNADARLVHTSNLKGGAQYILEFAGENEYIELRLYFDTLRLRTQSLLENTTEQINELDGDLKIALQQISRLF